MNLQWQVMYMYMLTALACVFMYIIALYAYQQGEHLYCVLEPTVLLTWFCAYCLQDFPILSTACFPLTSIMYQRQHNTSGLAQTTTQLVSQCSALGTLPCTNAKCWDAKICGSRALSWCASQCLVVASHCMLVRMLQVCCWLLGVVCHSSVASFVV